MQSKPSDPARLIAAASTRAVPVYFAGPGEIPRILAALSPLQSAFATAQDFAGQAGRVVLLPDGDGGVAAVLFGTGEEPDPMQAGKLAGELPAGVYTLENAPEPELACFSFLAGAYRFARYKEVAAREVRLKVPAGIDRDRLTALVRAVWMARDLINTPASDMGPAELEAAARAVCRDGKGAGFSAVKGAALKRGFPMIEAVGRASTRAPRLIDFSWGRKDAPKVTLVGKGVCFDTGGLDIKPSSAMLLMKKDMGGAANILALAQMVMAAGLDVRLRVLVPAVENSIAGDAFRPGDVLPSRKGLTVEIGNTDAEGRLVLADALTLADAEKPELVVDMATLTGAARVALGPEMPPFYTDDDALAGELSAASAKVRDPIWRMPLWKPYMAMLDSRTADINNAGSGGFAGSITAALFLSRFVEKARSWVHLDVYAWNPSAKAGRPEGGEAQGIRALFAVLESRYPPRRLAKPQGSRRMRTAPKR
ncbi:MAG: M17 family metallopeptidase [Flavobacteriaceae bacterium]